jgi:DNA repair protein RecO (recombination protein O)
MNYKTKGIVIKRLNFGEADSILTILTERFGKVKAIAKGVRKIRSHLAGSLEPFMLIDLQLHEGKTFYIITGAVIDKDFPLIHTDLKKTARAFFLGELIDRFLEENQKAPEVFQLFISSLEEVDQGLPGPLIQAFQLKIIEASGFKPELHNCVHCREKITAGNNFWDETEGGVICGKCNQTFHHGHEISDQSIKLLRFIIDNNFATISKLKTPPETELEADRILTSYIETILERKLKSKDFLGMVA